VVDEKFMLEVIEGKAEFCPLASKCKILQSGIVKGLICKYPHYHGCPTYNGKKAYYKRLLSQIKVR